MPLVIRKLIVEAITTFKSESKDCSNFANCYFLSHVFSKSYLQLSRFDGWLTQKQSRGQEKRFGEVKEKTEFDKWVI